MTFTRDVLNIDNEAEARHIASGIEEIVHKQLRRKGAVVAVSGGIDSSLCLALCVMALGNENVFALMLPERDSSPDSRRLAEELVKKFKVASHVQDITAALEAEGAYRAQDEAISIAVPGYQSGWKFKIVLPSILGTERLSISRVTVQRPDGSQESARMPAGAYLQLVASTNFKQRTRKSIEYFHADRLNFAVCGTPNRLEYDQGFFVKGGDGLADFKPIAHLYKTQVFALARHLGVPEGICSRTPTTDTFSLPQTQEEFYFALPYAMMDLCLFALNHGILPEDAAGPIGITAEQVKRVYQDILAKRRTTLPLHLPGLLLGDVAEISSTVLESMRSAKHQQ